MLLKLISIYVCIKKRLYYNEQDFCFDIESKRCIKCKQKCITRFLKYFYLQNNTNNHNTICNNNVNFAPKLK